MAASEMAHDKFHIKFAQVAWTLAKKGSIFIFKTVCKHHIYSVVENCGDVMAIHLTRQKICVKKNENDYTRVYLRGKLVAN